ncbi:ATPase, AAA family [Opisthorchis viverrini]|uniref:ATPase, AAA family n=1 Tax=Opisthorchis viverrini TaxID=6198 RepID=A0A1S8X2I0_OPIVI|nr:ATPase, AAA family [Opisthorchis viverrini]
MDSCFKIRFCDLFTVHFKANSPRGSSDADHNTTSMAMAHVSDNSLSGPHPASTSESELDQPGAQRLRRLRPRVPVQNFNLNVGLHRDRSNLLQSSNETMRRKRGRPRKYPRLDNRSATSDQEATKEPRSASAEDHSDDAGMNGDQGGRGPESDTRRYPVRNRRHTAMYQVEYPQSTHGPARNWLAGTGYEHSNRGRRHRTSSRFYRGLHHCGSSTSSSMDSDSGTSTPERDPMECRLPSSHSSWRRAAPERNSMVDVDEDETRFERRRTKSIMNARSELLPINLRSTDPTIILTDFFLLFGSSLQIKSTLSDRLLCGTNLADIEPMTMDDSVGFDQVGGHDRHILALKESIVLPLMYPDVFSGFGIDPPRGVLFCGPPGKTLLARALANECTRMSSARSVDGTKELRRPIAFFMRKGADCLSKWVGESERQLRLLFDQAYRMRPSIIFFDEIDGLAPVRSSKQDQIHSSIVSTLLSLMDGLDSRAEVVIIGATNRPDAIDPALRRPGRFDREFTFSLPCESVRRRILEVHTAKWKPAPDPELLSQLAAITSNFSGADLKALVTEACLCCLRRQYPQVYESRVKLALDQKYLKVQRPDWLRALKLVRPSKDRTDVDSSALNLTPVSSALASTKRYPLSLTLADLFSSTLDQLTQLLSYALAPPGSKMLELSDWTSIVTNFQVSGSFSNSRLLLTGDVPTCLMSAVWHRLESVQVFTLSPANLVAFPTSIGVCPEAAIAQILSAVRQAARNNAAQSQAEDELVQGVVLYIPQVDLLLRRIPRSAAFCLVDRIEALTQELIVEDFALSFSEHMTGGCEFVRAASERSRRVFVIATLAGPHRTKLHKAPTVEKSPITVQPESLSKLRSLTDVTSPVRRVSQSVTPTVDVNKMCNGVGLVRKSPGGRKLNQVSPMRDKSLLSTRPSPTISVSPMEDPIVFNDSSSCSSASVSDIDNSNGAENVPVLRKNAVGDSKFGSNTLRSPANLGERPASNVPRSHKRRYYYRLLTRLFHQFNSVRIRVPQPSKAAKITFFTPVLMVMPRRLARADGSLIIQSDAYNSGAGRPPSPVPVSVEPDDASNKRIAPVLRPEELLALEREEAQLFRRLRQVLRRVVAHLARHRRFAVFSRPVQTDEAPDYYEVIRNPMDLGSVRDRIDARKYVNVEDFMKDIELIYHNALEYNPANVPRSRDIRARAAEFWDEACLKMEEELYPPDLNERCRAATEAQAMRAAASKHGPAESNPRTATPKISVTSSTVGRSSVSSNPSIPLTKPLPMPQGGRFSRRLHGQPPILELSDIQLLQSVRERRGSSATLPSPESKVIREKLGIDEANSENYQRSGVRTPSPRVSRELSSPTPDVHSLMTGTSKTVVESTEPGDLPTGTSQSNGPVASSSPNRTRSPDISVTELTLDKPDSGPHPDDLNAFLQTVVNGTLGWSAEELIKLHREFSYLVLCGSHRTGILTSRHF